MLPVNGQAFFGSQCPYGSVPPPFAADLEAWSCPIGVKPLQLAEPMQPLVLQADCTKKYISVRTQNRRVDSSWEVMPDGSFFITLEGVAVKLGRDGAGNSNCTVMASVDVSGKLNCGDRDKVKIDFETVWWLGQRPPTPQASASPGVTPLPSPLASSIPSPTPQPMPSPRPGRSPHPLDLTTFANSASGTTCKMPVGCYLYSSATINQCQ